MGLLSGFDNIDGWAVLQKNSSTLETAYAAGSSSASDAAYFQSVASSLKTPQDLLSNYRALTFVTTAFGLGSEVNQTAILKKLMTQDPSSSSSLAQQLADPAYLKFANALSNWNPPPFSTSDGVQSVVSNYQQQSFQSSVGQDNTALQEAMVFTQGALGAKSLSDLMSSSAMTNVLTTALGLPQAFGALDYTQQVAILTPRVDVKQFATQQGVAKFVQQYLAMAQLQSSSSSGSGSQDPILSIFNGSGSQTTSTGITLTAANFASSSLNLFV
jgi:hypothetical protein